MATLARDVKAGLPRVRWGVRGLGLVVLLALIAAAAWWGRDLRLPVRSLRVSGTFTHITPAQIRRIAVPYVHAGLLRADLGGLRRALERQPWVSRVAVARSWPDAVSIRVWEAVPVARWDQHQILTRKGRTFALPAAQMPKGLPQLHGPNGSGLKLEKMYQAEAGGFVRHGLRLASLRIDADGEWLARTAGGLLIKLGRHQVRARLQRFLNAALPALNKQMNDVAYVDLRYSNGFAVGWKPGSSPASAGES